MAGSDYRSLIDKLVGAAIGILIAALAIYAAVHLIESVLFAFVGIVLTASIISVAILVFRARYRGW